MLSCITCSSSSDKHGANNDDSCSIDCVKPSYSNNSNNSSSSNGGHGFHSSRDHHTTTVRSLISNQLLKGRLNSLKMMSSCISLMPSNQRLGMEKKPMINEEDEDEEEDEDDDDDDDDNDDEAAGVEQERVRLCNNSMYSSSTSCIESPSPNDSSLPSSSSASTRHGHLDSSHSSLMAHHHHHHHYINHLYSHCKQRNVSILDQPASSTMPLPSPLPLISPSPPSTCHEDSIHTSRNEAMETAVDRRQHDQAMEEETASVRQAAEWVAQVEPGIWITFQSLQQENGGNELKRIRFSRDMFDKAEAQQWWAKNCDKVHELYNVRKRNPRLLRSAPTSHNLEDKKHCNNRLDSNNTNPKLAHRQVSGPACHGSIQDLNSAMFRALHGPESHSMETTHKDQQHGMAQYKGPSNQHHLADTRLTEISADPSSDQVYEDEPGVYITTAASPQGLRELKRIRFSRELFDEKQARVWWEQNRMRIYKKYL